jgi:hypothetical protein
MVRCCTLSAARWSGLSVARWFSRGGLGFSLGSSETRPPRVGSIGERAERGFQGAGCTVSCTVQSWRVRACTGTRYMLCTRWDVRRRRSGEAMAMRMVWITGSCFGELIEEYCVRPVARQRGRQWSVARCPRWGVHCGHGDGQVGVGCEGVVSAGWGG